MNTSHPKTLIAAALASLLMTACSSLPTRPEGADNARVKLTQLQADPRLASLAPVAIKEAELAVLAAEKPQKDAAVGNHLVVMAARKVDTAWAQAQTRLAEDERSMLKEQRESARLDSRTREAEMARNDATLARNDATLARLDASTAKNQADLSRADADVARRQADAADVDTAVAMQQAADLQRQITALNARPTDRGLVVTLGDVLFSSGRAELNGGAASSLDKLVAFLGQYPDRTVAIEGHTDSIGSAATNLGLSQRRADAVKAYLVSRGIAAGRLTASGKGEAVPIAGNVAAADRQQNRRVEVIIADLAARSK
ncbi:MAG: OmpA/MotB domain protein [Moraxellaceae bacterium]|jgi:outer membrane protein OmpA-like peptidoglycan-associated protein|nr:OmpA/MotB domain protein [Moraxellaceae bacterium]